MIQKDNKRFILSLGGSLIIPNGGIDISFLSSFNKFIRKKVRQGCRFFIVTGGGAICRDYQKAALAVIGQKLTDEDLDWLGVHSTRLNGHLLRTIFRDIAYEYLIKHYDLIDKKALDYKVVIGVGWQPGWSTDHDAVLLAQDYNIGLVINLTNTTHGYIYDKDPKKFPEAKPLKKMTWDQVIKIMGEKWTPGANVPFDPIAAKLAKKIGLKVINCNGRDLRNLDNILEGRKFVGTIIE